jgi:hypothetical protein
MDRHVEARQYRPATPPASQAPEATVEFGTPLQFAAGGLTFRSAHGTRRRAALEVLSDNELFTVDVDSVFTTQLLGALRGRRHRVPWAVAWGALPPDGQRPHVAFHNRRFRRSSRTVPVTEVGGRFWVAGAQGAFRTVTVTDQSDHHTWRLACRRHTARP